MSELPDDPAVNADMESVDKHWTKHIHTAWMLYAAGTTLIGTISASSSWKKSNTRMAKPAQLLLIFNAIVCVLLTAYKFNSKHIGPLFVL